MCCVFADTTRRVPIKSYCRKVTILTAKQHASPSFGPWPFGPRPLLLATYYLLLLLVSVHIVAEHASELRSRVSFFVLHNKIIHNRYTAFASALALNKHKPGSFALTFNNKADFFTFKPEGTKRNDYITKPFSLNELSARVAAHLRRDERNKCKPLLLTSENLIVNLSERTVSYGGNSIPFSKREFDLIEFLMTNANQVFNRERIYEAVWGYEAEGDSSVVKEHIRKIRAKLHEITGQEYIETVWGVGYKWNR